MSSGAVLQVVILRNGGLVGTEMLVPGDYRIGRDPTCDIHIDEPTLSRVHARLVFNGQRVGLQDLGSDNGVLINGEKIQAREVKSLDDVNLGKVTLKLKIIGRKEDQPAVPQGKAALEQTVPLAARPNSAQLRAALEPVPAPTPSAPAPAVQPRPGSRGAVPPPRFAETEAEVTAPGQPPAMAIGGALQATQPSARRAQVAPEIKPQPMPAAPPRPVIGLVPPPAPAATPAPAPAVAKAPPPAQERPRQGSLDATVAKVERPELKPPEATDGESTQVVPPGTRPSVRARVLWGDQMVVCKTFGFGETVTAAERESAPLPVYQFGFEKPTLLARVHADSWAVHVPRGAIVETLGPRGWAPTQPSLDKKGKGIVPLPSGAQVRLRQGKIAVELATVAPQGALPRKKMQAELSLLVPLIAGVAAMASLIVFMPKNLDVPDFVPQRLPGIRPALLAPPPKPKEPEKKKEPEKVAEKRNEAKTEKPKQVAKAQPKPQAKPAPQQVQAPAAVAALQKLTSSPAMKNLMAVTSKIGGGGRPNGLKMVGLKGIGPVALAGAGPGIGGGFGGGPVTAGREQLTGIGAIGIGHALKGSPGGVVVQAPAKQAQVHGSISREEIAKVINAHMQAIRACYEKALLHDPGLTGKLVIEWTIDMSGGVQSFKTKSSSLKNPDVGECILDNLKAWRFPRPTGGTVVVSYPFVFNSVGF